MRSKTYDSLKKDNDTSQSLLTDIIRFRQEFLIFLLTEGVHLTVLVIFGALWQNLLQRTLHEVDFLPVLKRRIINK